MVFSNQCKAFSCPLAWCGTGITVTVHNMIDPGIETTFEKGFAKRRGIWPTTYKLHMTETFSYHEDYQFLIGLSWRVLTPTETKTKMQSHRTFHKLEGGPEGKGNLLRDSISWRDKKTSWSRWCFWYWTTRVENMFKSSCLVYCRWSEQLLRNIRWY